MGITNRAIILQWPRHYVVMLCLLFGACDPSEKVASWASAEGPTPKQAAEEAPYDLEITFKGLVGFVPVTLDGTPAKAGDTVEAFWALLVNAASGVGPCASTGPGWNDPGGKVYHHHFPYLRYQKENRVGPADGAYASGDDDKPHRDIPLMRKEVRLTLGKERADAGVRLAGERGKDCSMTNNRSYACVADIASFAGDLATVCQQCVAPTNVSQRVASRLRLDEGFISVSDIEKYKEEGKERPIVFEFPNTWKKVNGEPFSDWTDYKKGADGKRLAKRLAKDLKVTITDIRGPVGFNLVDLNGTVETSTLQLSSSGGHTLKVEILNMTRDALDDKPHFFNPFDGREFRWYYYLSENLPEPEECASTVMPSLKERKRDKGPPICPGGGFRAIAAK